MARIAKEVLAWECLFMVSSSSSSRWRSVEDPFRADGRTDARAAGGHAAGDAPGVVLGGAPETHAHRALALERTRADAHHRLAGHVAAGHLQRHGRGHTGIGVLLDAVDAVVDRVDAVV